MIISEGDFKGKFIDELIYDRNIARENKDFELSDKIRNILDEKFVFIFEEAKPIQYDTQIQNTEN